MNKRRATTSIPLEGKRGDEDENDRDIVERCQAGDKDAFRTLFERYQRRAYALAFSVVHNADEALDVVQEAFLKAFRHIDSFEGSASVYTWLYRIVMNVSIDHLRKQSRAQSVDYDDTVAHLEEGAPGGMESLLPQMADGNPAQALARREMREKIDEALGRLSPNHRAVLMMREIDGLSYEEMSKVMKCSKGTIMSRLFHARRYMQKHLIDLMGADAVPKGDSAKVDETETETETREEEEV